MTMPNKKRTKKKVARVIRHYNVYVIELDKAVLQHHAFTNRNPDYIDGKACFYVGQTAKTPEERFEVHKQGGMHANKYVKKYWKYLRKKLYERHNPIATRQEAELVEEWLAKKLQDEGYAVWWN
jgi:hypothetical protein